MAAATQTTLSPELTGCVDLNGLKLRRFRFSSITTTNTFDSKIHNVVEFAVGCGGLSSANNSTQAVADGYSPNILGMSKAIKVTYDDVAGLGQFGFIVTSGPATNVDLYVWSRF